KKSATETQAAMNDLKALSEKGLTREDLIQLLVNSPSDMYLQTVVSMARPALDYIFFQTLTDQLEHSEGEEKRALIDLRDKLIKLTQEIDKAVQEHTQKTLKLMDELMNAPDTAKALEEHLEEIDDFFVQLVQSELQQARKKSDLERVGKIEKVIIALQKYTAPPPEIEFIEQLISTEKDEDRNALLEKNADQITPEFLQIFDQLVKQSEGQHQSAEMVELLKKTYKQVLRFSMKKNLTA
ncbi:MAG: hypothetical protein ABFD14_10075, partial [Anaerolineaceae bacterium]